MNRILLETSEVDGDLVCLNDGRAEHIRSVLRLTPGRDLRIGLTDGPRGTGTIESVDPAVVRVRCAFEPEPPPRPRVNLLLAVPRPKVLKRLWAPLASLGLDRIVLTHAARVERNYFDTHWLRPEHYRPLLIEGLQQAGDTRLPRVSIERRFRPFVEDALPSACGDAVRIVADPAASRRFRDVRVPADRAVWMAIGPEGGWVPFELALLATAGFEAVRAGERVLRSDVACIALLSILNETCLET